MTPPNNRAEPAVKGVSFGILKGEAFSLLGPNGAGKTTTISMLSTLLAPTRGDAVIAGYTLSKAAAEAKRAIGIVPQDIALYPTLSARENLNFLGADVRAGRRGAKTTRGGTAGDGGPARPRRRPH